MHSCMYNWIANSMGDGVGDAKVKLKMSTAAKTLASIFHTALTFNRHPAFICITMFCWVHTFSVFCIFYSFFEREKTRSHSNGWFHCSFWLWEPQTHTHTLCWWRLFGFFRIIYEHEPAKKKTNLSTLQLMMGFNLQKCKLLTVLVNAYTCMYQCFGEIVSSRCYLHQFGFVLNYQLQRANFGMQQKQTNTTRTKL